jgi:hypothetical protein
MIPLLRIDDPTELGEAVIKLSATTVFLLLLDRISPARGAVQLSGLSLLRSAHTTPNLSEEGLGANTMTERWMLSAVEASHQVRLRPPSVEMTLRRDEAARAGRASAATPQLLRKGHGSLQGS